MTSDSFIVSSVRILSDDIEMKFEFSNCSVLFLRRGKARMNEEMSMPGKKMRTYIEEGFSYKYFVILERSKRNDRNIITTTNSRTASLIRYLARIIRWTKAELQALDRKVRKL